MSTNEVNEYKEVNNSDFAPSNPASDEPIDAFSEAARTADSSLGGGERGKDIDVSGGSSYGDGQTEFGGAGRLNDDSYSRGEEGGSTGQSSHNPQQTGEVESTSADLAGQERAIYP